MCGRYNCGDRVDPADPLVRGFALDHGAAPSADVADLHRSRHGTRPARAGRAPPCADSRTSAYRSGMSTGTPLPTLPMASPSGPTNSEQRRALARRVRSLTHLGLGWHVLEAAVAIAAGVVAGSVALVGFGADSVIEAAAALVVLWLVTGGRESRACRAARAAIDRGLVRAARHLHHGRVHSRSGRRPSSRRQLGRRRSLGDHARRDAAACRREAPRRDRAWFVGRHKREPPDDALSRIYSPPHCSSVCSPTPSSAGGGPTRSWHC